MTTDSDQTPPVGMGEGELQPLEDFIRDIESELRTGGGATLDELYNLALAIKAVFERYGVKS